MTALQEVLRLHNPVRVEFRTRSGQPIRNPFLGLDCKPVWYVQNGRAIVMGPKRDGVRPVLFVENKRSSYSNV